MMKRYIYISLMVIFSCSLIHSQDIKKTGGFARIQSMGVNPYIIDPFYQTVNPAWGAVYDNFLFGDIGSTAGAFSSGGVGQFVSFNFALGNKLTLGAMLSRNDFVGVSIARLDPFRALPLPIPGNISFPGGVVDAVNGSAPGTPNVAYLDNNLEFMGTLTIGRMSIGLGIAYASTNTETRILGAEGNNVGSASQFGINAGILTNLTSSLKLDLGASLIFPSASYEPGAPNSNITEASQTIIAINGRLFYKYSGKLWFVPMINFATASGSIDIGTTPTSTSADLNSVTVISAGIGINYTIGDFLLAGGPSFTSLGITIPAGTAPEGGVGTPELGRSAFIFPIWNLGMEWNLLDWLVGRFGYMVATGKTTIELQDGESIDENIATFFFPTQGGVRLGVGFRFGDFSLDATVNEDILRQGLANIGGSGATFAYLSASYAIP